MLSKLKFQPGINRDATNYANSGGWFDSDFIRFRNGLPEKIGGWTKIYQYQSALIGKCRKLYDWSSLDGNAYLACPTNIKFYVDNSSSVIDITPLRRSVDLASAPITTDTSTNASTSFVGEIDGCILTVSSVVSGTILLGSTVSGSGVSSGTKIVEFITGTGGAGTYKVNVTQYLGSVSMTTTTTTVTVTDVNNGSIIGDIVTISGSGAVGGLAASKLNTQFFIQSIINANAYSITVNGTATSSTSGGGSNVSAKYEFHPGVSTNVALTGWGGGPWGGVAGFFGWGFGPSTTLTTYYSGLWTVDNYGEDMVACPRDLTNFYTLGTTPISVSNGSNVVTVTQLNHGFSNGNAIVIGGIDTSLGGLSVYQLNGTHTISVVNANAYTFVATSNATSTETGGTECEVYTSSIIYWDINDITGPAVSLSNLGSLYAKKYLPYVATEVLVSDQNRQIIAFGCNPYDVTKPQDKMTVRWSDSSDPTNWDAADLTTTAGDNRLSSGSYIVTAIQNREEILIWTDTSLYTMTYVGPPYGYAFNYVGSNFDIIGPNAKIVTGSIAYWMGSNNFYSYGGRIEPLPCTVRDYVFLDIDTDNGDKVYCSADSGNNEIIWFYPSKSQSTPITTGSDGIETTTLDGSGASSVDIDRYVVYNYAENAWYYGSLARTAWIDRIGHQTPRAVSVDGFLYQHESGFNDGSTNPETPINAYIQSSPVEIGDGDKFMFVNRVIPDLTFRNSETHNGDMQPTVKFTIKPQDYPGAEIGAGDERNATRKSSATLTVNRFTDQMFTRLRARSVALRVESDELNVSWRLGVPRIDMREDGRR